MRSPLSFAVSLLLAIALIVAPLPVDVATAAEQASAGDSCCGCCKAAPDAAPASVEGPCCPKGTDGPTPHDPASSDPCQSDCGQCPCCAVNVPFLLAILAPAGQVLAPAQFAQIGTVSDALSTRSDEPLLPPPRV